MFRHTLRPLSRSLRTRQLSTSTTSTQPISSRRNLYLSTAVATFGLTAYALSQRDTVRNDSSSNSTLPGSANWKPGVAQYDEDLKVNRHKIAAQKGTTPDSPLHNSSSSPDSHHISSARLSAAAHNTRKGDGTQGPAAPEVVKEKAEEGKAESAYNEETGEINWDCPCLGGMAQGPCGEDFKAAFSCFVHSDQEPKGIDCVEKFKAMQDCFRKHPDVYGEELEDSEEPAEPFGQPTSTDGPGPLSAGTVSGSPLPEGHPDKAKVPRAPVKEPPKNSPIPYQTHENNPAKGIEKLQPRGDRADKKGKPSGDGTI